MFKRRNMVVPSQFICLHRVSGKGSFWAITFFRIILRCHRKNMANLWDVIPINLLHMVCLSKKNIGLEPTWWHDPPQFVSTIRYLDYHPRHSKIFDYVRKNLRATPIECGSHPLHVAISANLHSRQRRTWGPTILLPLSPNSISKWGNLGLAKWWRCIVVETPSPKSSPPTSMHDLAVLSYFTQWIPQQPSMNPPYEPFAIWCWDEG